MIRKDYFKIRKIVVIFIIFLILNLFFGCINKKIFVVETAAHRTEAIIVDHTCTDITKIPNHWINKAKADFGISYGHTSHGSQVVSGMEALSANSKIYSFGNYNSKNSLTIYDREPSGDLGNPDRKTWATRTRDLLDNGWGDTNLIMWSWCGQVSSASEKDIKTYLSLMAQLEEDYPSVVFIYMTGHLDGSGESGNLHIRNNQIRDYCLKNNKILFDFADIESYDPDGNYFLNKGSNDHCDYWKNGNRRNWADEWCDRNPGKCTQYRCAHSEPLNCDLKAKAFWWMMAKLAGWSPGK